MQGNGERSLVDRAVAGFAGLAAAVVLVDAAWITYAVFVRYVLRAPDRFVIEATSLLLIPLVFAGAPYALKTNGFPRVTILLDRLGEGRRTALEYFNLVLIVFVGGFYLAASVAATLSAYNMGSTSDILLWPEFVFWIPMALAMALFVAYGLQRLWRSTFVATRRPEG